MPPGRPAGSVRRGLLASLRRLSSWGAASVPPAGHPRGPRSSSCPARKATVCFPVAARAAPWCSIRSRIKEGTSQSLPVPGRAAAVAQHPNRAAYTARICFPQLQRPDVHGRGTWRPSAWRGLASWFPMSSGGRRGSLGSCVKGANPRQGAPEGPASRRPCIPAPSHWGLESV